MKMQISDEQQAAIFALEDLGPFALFQDLEDLRKRLPPPASMYLAGYLAGMKEEPHPDHRARMRDRDFADGYRAGMEIAAARRQMEMEAGHV